MDDNKAMIGVALGSWLVALAVGTLAGTLLWLLGGWGFLQGAFVGGVIFVIGGAVISWVMTRPLPAPNAATVTPATPGADARSTKVDPPKAETPKAAPPKADPPKAAPIDVPPAPTVPKVQPSKRLPGQEELASRKGEWKYEKGGAEKPAAKAKESAKPKPSASDDHAGRPGYLSDAPNGEADDLKKISGVGPKLEETLNSLGIWHYEQVAQLSGDDIAWVDERLRFKGRIERDDWIGQAKALAANKG